MLVRALLCVLLFTAPVQAATYYVATTGSDSNDGSTGNPWRNPQKCAQPPVAAGDTCLVRDGSYTATPFVILISTSVSSASGTAANPITIKSENYHGAKLVQPTRNGQAVAVYVGRPYYVIEGFDVDGAGVTYNTGTSSSHAGIGVYASNVTVRRNHVRNIARTLCSNSSFGNAGVFINNGLSNILVEKNLIHTIGRLRNGESGCVTTISQHDHGIYITWGTDITVRYNVVYDTNRGYAMNIYSTSSSVHTRYKIYNNTFAGRSPTGAPSGHIIIGGIWTNSEIKNNIFYQPDADLIIQRFNLSASSSGNVISYNRTNLNLPGTDFLFGTSTPTGFTSSNNTENVALGLANASCTQADGGCENADFTLAAGSVAIDAGTNVSLPYNGSAPDVGAFETLVFASCEVPFGAANTIELTFTSNAHLLGDTLTTFTARRNGSNNALTGAATKIGDTIVSLPVTTTYVGGDTVDISWASGGFGDHILIGGLLNQPFLPVTNQSCTNNAGGAPTFTFTQAAYRFHGLYGLQAAPDWRGAENVATFSVQKGGAFRLRLAIVCGVAACDPTGFYLRYATGGGYTLIPDTFAAGNIALCGGTYSGSTIPSDGTVTISLLSTAGTFVPGAIIFTAAAVPTLTLANGNKSELEYCIRFDTDATGTYTFRLYKQSGDPLDAHTVTPSVTVTDYQGDMGF